MLTAAEAAPHLRLSPYHVVVLCRTGKLPAVKPGKAWLIDAEDLLTYLGGTA